MLIRGMREGDEKKIFLCYPRDSGTSHQYFCERGAYLVRVDCLYLIKLMVVGFCSRCDWIVGSSINVLLI